MCAGQCVHTRAWPLTRAAWPCSCRMWVSSYRQQGGKRWRLYVSQAPGLTPQAPPRCCLLPPAALPFYVQRSPLACITHAGLPPSFPPVVFRWPRTIIWLINLTTTTVIERGMCWEGHARVRSSLPPSRLLLPPDLRVLPPAGPGLGLCTPSLIVLQLSCKILQHLQLSTCCKCIILFYR